MFVLAEIKDYIRIAPCNFHKPLKSALAEEINKKLANKVVMNVGLAIALWDITELGDSHIIPGDGCFHTRVSFRYIVFRPFLTEILIGKVKSCSREGVVELLFVSSIPIVTMLSFGGPSTLLRATLLTEGPSWSVGDYWESFCSIATQDSEAPKNLQHLQPAVTLGFFDDIVIPNSALQHPSRFDEAEQVWVWEYQVDNEKHDLFMDIGESIRFRVTAETFEETSPTGPENTDGEVESKVPYSLTASINEPGLGLMTWWANT